MKLSGVILCGGASRRMGQDKAWLPIGDEAMLQRVVRIISEVCDPVVVVAGPTQRLPDLPGSVQVCRDAEEHLGPIAGLQIGLAAVPNDRPVFVCGCDMPFVSAELTRFLLGEFLPGHVVVPVVAGVRQPLATIYAPEANAIVDAKPRSLQELLTFMNIIEVSEERLRAIDPQLRSFMRINDPQSYKEAVEILQAERETQT
jgi:molybdopterin-guanine dinucleotide biosynthesis protein A